MGGDGGNLRVAGFAFVYQSANLPFAALPYTRADFKPHRGDTMTTTSNQTRRIDLIDVITARHTQVQAILESLISSFSAGNSEPDALTVQNTIWAAQELLGQAQKKARML
jgi:hypothetical protein